MLDISDILSDLDFRVAFEVEKRRACADEHGRTQITGERFQYVGCIQPATPKELERLPEADREREVIAVYAASPFSLADEESAPDVIFWNGRAYEACSVEKWPGWYKALAQLLPEDEFGQ